MGTGVTRGLSKGFKSFKKFSGGQIAQRALIGEDNYDEMHFVSTSAIDNENKLISAEKQVKAAEKAADVLRRRQADELASLDDEENRRIKKILTARRGTRSYRGGPMFRGRAVDSAGSAPRAAASGASSA